MGALLFAGPGEAQEIYGIRLGMDMEVAQTIMRRAGGLSVEQKGPLTVTSTGEFMVGGCDGKVAMVVRDLGEDFRLFAEAARARQKSLGPPTEVDFGDGRRGLNGIFIRWLDGGGNVYATSYTKIAAAPGFAREVLAARDSATCLSIAE